MAAKKDKKEMTLEEAMRRLEEITESMEKETLPLDQMMALYKEGKALEATCRNLLDAAEKEIEILSSEENVSDTEE